MKETKLKSKVPLKSTSISPTIKAAVLLLTPNRKRDRHRYSLKKDYSLTDVFPVGRLDKDSEGLIIVTNDGRMTGPLLDPAAKHEKEYEVLVDKPLTTMFSKLMALGVDIEGYRTKPAKVVTFPKNDKKFLLTLTEGKSTKSDECVQLSVTKFNH